MGKTIGIISFKGGVGKTISAINIAAALSKMEYKVLVVDTNFLSPTLHVYLGLLTPDLTLKEVIRNDLMPEEAIYEHDTGIHVMPCNFYKDINLDIFKEKIDELKERYDFVILDSGPSYTEEIAAVLMVADEMILVTTPDYATLVTTLRSAELMKENNIPVTGILINKHKNKSYELTKKDIEETTGLPVIGEIRDDNKIMKSFSRFMPITHYSPRNKNSRKYNDIANYILNNNYKEEKEILKLIQSIEDGSDELPI
jgi:MinD-like ATPase involved in chromosome partitioning or flagellar assembly